MFKAIIFDCFGVLVTEAWTGFKAQHFGHDPKLMARVNDISHRADGGKISFEEAVRQTAALADVGEAVVVASLRGNATNQLLMGYIAELKKDYKIGMLSNAAANWLPEMFTTDQLSLFDAVNLSFETGFVKPDPRAYQTIAESLGQEPAQCVYVDDREMQLEGARQAGLQTVFYKDFDHTKAELQRLLADSKS